MVGTRFGLRVPAFPVDRSSIKAFMDQVLGLLGKLEHAFDSAWVCDHFHPWARFVPEHTPTIEGFTAISYLSGIFRKMAWGNIVLCNSYRNPALLAKMGATLQVMTGGRFILGIGAGWKEDEYLAYGYSFPPAATRIQQLEEGVQIIRKMWTEPKATFEGRHHSIKDAICNPRPDPFPPIMIGGGGEKLTLKVVARHADWWNLANTSASDFQHKIEILERHCDQVDRNPTEIVKTLGNIVAIARTDRAARKLVAESPFAKMGNTEGWIVGDPDSVVESLSKYTELGIEHFILRFVDFPETDCANLFVEEVIPSFAR